MTWMWRLMLEFHCSQCQAIAAAKRNCRCHRFEQTFLWWLAHTCKRWDFRRHGAAPRSWIWAKSSSYNDAQNGFDSWRDGRLDFSIVCLEVARWGRRQPNLIYVPFIMMQLWVGNIWITVRFLCGILYTFGWIIDKNLALRLWKRTTYFYFQSSYAIRGVNMGNWW